MTGPLPTLPGVVKSLEMRRVANLHPGWPARLVLSVAVRNMEESK